MNSIILLCFLLAGLCFLPACTQTRSTQLKVNAAHPDKIKKLYDLGYQNMRSMDTVGALADSLLHLGKTSIDARLKGKILKAKYYWLTGNYQSAMHTVLQALELAQQSQLNPELPVIYSIIGNLYKEKKNYPKALESATKGLEAARTLKDTANIIFHIRLKALFTRSYGTELKDSTLINQGFKIYLNGLTLAESSPTFEKDRIAYYNNIAQIYLTDRKDYQRAIYYAQKALAIATKYKQFTSLTYSYNWLGESYFKLGQQEQGLQYLQQALQFAQQIKLPYREMEIYQVIARCNQQRGNYQQAFAYFTRYDLLRDSLALLENLRLMNELEVQYEAGRKDQEINVLTQKSKTRAMQMYATLGIMGVLVISGVIFGLQFRTIRRKNSLLNSQNEQINEQAEKLKLLMKELHHRVKNNLQIVSSLLSLQSNRLQDEDARKAVKVGRQRIEAMSLIHRSLYQQDQPNLVNMPEYITDLVESLMESFGVDKNQLTLDLHVSVTELDVDKALPLGLIINEWVTNAFKYAYQYVPEPRLSISLHDSNGLQLHIQDNGPGLPAAIWEKPQTSFGLKLVKVLSKQLNGNCSVENHHGTTFTLHIPEKILKKAS
ncbi:sensor histidine kinase [Adhaeribacter swui]|uniref:histidine kinase n=1 Tax=Adhaeribacter swui TaxID=2086471 RepID=A0A7G7G8B7_9BACT|nr:histidine kinase dimerization/phosphoacceptor domain -containing protein [Adhaeribacter swui]QNF33401.1 sensor histidine kinase [Adhaeribacter swui]